MYRFIASQLLFCALVIAAPLAASAAPITVPTDLNVGDQYRLVFVTSTTTADATSSNDIADYNAFVTGVAAGVPELASLGTTWTAIGSTDSVDARDNTATNPNVATGVPIYRLDDVRVANDNSDLWDGGLIAPLSTSETGTDISSEPDPFVWTGSEMDGTADPVGEFGDIPVVVGDYTSVTSTWVRHAFSISHEWRLYAVSETITVVPEPGAMTLMAIGATAVVGWQLRRRRHRG